MLKIIDAKNGLLDSYSIYHNNFQSGQIAQFYRNIESETDLLCGISDGIAPIGIIDDFCDEFTDPALGSNLIHVWNIAGLIGKTDQYEANFYKENDWLYVSKNGLFTVYNRHPKYLSPVAVVLEHKEFLTFRWLRRTVTENTLFRINNVYQV